MQVIDLGTMAYRDAWALQERAQQEVLAGDEERLLLVEHPPVITLGRRPGLEKHIMASADRLASLGVEVVESDRGGDVTFHGPGQLVAYPIVRIADHRLSVSGYVHRLEQIVIAALASWNVIGQTDSSAVGVWVGDAEQLAKICAIGVRIRRGVAIHGIALNVNVDLSFFDLIVPCGLTGRPVTSLGNLLGQGCPSMEDARRGIARSFQDVFGRGSAGEVKACPPPAVYPSSRSVAAASAADGPFSGSPHPPRR